MFDIDKHYACVYRPNFRNIIFLMSRCNARNIKKLVYNKKKHYTYSLLL